MDVVAVRPDLIMIVEPPGRSYALRRPGGVLLVDTGLPGLGATGRRRCRRSAASAGLAADTVCFGHGSPLQGDAVRLLHDAATADVRPWRGP